MVIPKPTNFSCSQQDVHTFELTWQDNSIGEEGFQIERKIDNGNWIIITHPPNDTTYIDDLNTKNDNWQTVYYKLYAFYQEEISEIVETNSDITFPAPSDLTYDKLTISSIKLNWADNSNGEEGFKIDKKVGSAPWYSVHAFVGENIKEWTDDYAEINETLQYRVYAFSGENLSSYEETGPIDNTIPTPENLTYVLYEDHLTLFWEYETTVIDSFVIARKVGENNWDYNYASVESTLLEWTDYDIESDEFYTYKIRAKYESYYSDYSNEAFILLENMVYVEGGTFDMGDHFNEGESNELPVHSVTLSDFFISQYEVTHTEYIEFLNSFGVSANGSYSGTELIDMDDPDCAISHNGTSFYFDGSNYAISADCPVIEVTWYGAVVFCNWKSQQKTLTECYNLSDWSCNFNANGYRLPTEAEWEYAGRGGTLLNYDFHYCGCETTSELPDYAWYHSNSNSQTHPVGTRLPNQLDIYDMSGNVHEWCWDWYSSSYYQECYNQGNVNDPTGPYSQTSRILRGGSWLCIVNFCRVAFRGYNVPTYSNYIYGFRFCRTK
ncbi:MAG: SUMF1/EgtB/PvdO family nonheme iron enzyme [Candidatus Cloacimonetes bacterium]|nr:SUMF1/EgtB/PvdO family nonheme iron enzyme [Candidatus Cloacimonadota bacterium]